MASLLLLPKHITKFYSLLHWFYQQLCKNQNRTKAGLEHECEDNRRAVVCGVPRTKPNALLRLDGE